MVGWVGGWGDTRPAPPRLPGRVCACASVGWVKGCVSRPAIQLRGHWLHARTGGWVVIGTDTQKRNPPRHLLTFLPYVTTQPHNHTPHSQKQHALMGLPLLPAAAGADSVGGVGSAPSSTNSASSTSSAAAGGANPSP